MNKLQSLKLDNIYKGYRFLKSSKVPEFKLIAYEFIHERTNAKHIHLARDDNNKTFGVQFRTPPPNSCGVPHILEHTVLCGSHKYPVRDPFFKMLTRSQATFMNAMTANDWTLYPFSSINHTDFLNLLSVYLDAVFKPKLDEQDFMQEGWRLEPRNFDNVADDFLLKGVVYNEMKGVFSSSMSNLAYKCENSILPTTYKHISGGAPPAIPSLTHQQLRNFHAQLYHPSNSKFFTYGNMNVEEILEIIDSDYLCKFKMNQSSTSIALEPKWTAPKSIETHCQADPMAAEKERQNSVVLSYAIDDCRSVYLNFTMGLIGSLLLNGDNAPLYRALIESGLGQDWASHLCGFDQSNRTSVFHIGLQGVHSDDVGKVEETIVKVLSDVCRDGFPEERIASSLHQIELGLRHDDANFGLRLIMGLSSGVNHDSCLSDLLESTRYIQRIKDDIRTTPDYLQKVIKKYLLNNNHRLTVKMTPTPTFDDEKAEEEQKMIKAMNANLTSADRETLADKCKKLLAAQNRTENVDCLPCLQISDISPQSEKYPFRMNPELRLQVNEYDTNGIMYLKMLFDLGGIDEHLLPYLPLFASVVTNMSTSSLHYRDISQAAESCSGGLHSSLHLSGNLTTADRDSVNAGLVLSSHCLYENTGRMLELWTDVIRGVELDDVDRLLTLIKMETSSDWSSDGISGSAHHFAMRRAAANLSPLGRLAEYWSGLEQAQLMRKMAAMSPGAVAEAVVPRLRQLKEQIFNKHRLRTALNVEAAAADSSASLIERFRLSVDGSDFVNRPLSLDTVLETNGQFVLPYTVNYVSTAIESACYHHPDFCRTRILSKLLSSKYLHKQIREIGGAYGSGAVASPGHFKFYSYRDPRSTETLDQFPRSLEWVLNEDLKAQMLNEAKLSVFQDTDKPLSAGSKGLSFFLDGVTDEMRQEQREGLFGVSADDVRTVAATLLASGRRSSVVIGPDQSLGADWVKIKVNE